MTNNAAIENLIKKYRLAITSKSKDLRFTTEEVGDIVAAIATLNSNTQILEQLHVKLDVVAKSIGNIGKTVQTQSTTNDGVDGGSFKR